MHIYMRAQIQVEWFDQFPLAHRGSNTYCRLSGTETVREVQDVPRFRQVLCAQTTSINLDCCDYIVVYSNGVSQLQIDAPL